MEKEQILEAALQNKVKSEEYENKIIASGSIFGAFVAMILGIIFFVIELLICKRVDFGLIAVGLISSAVQFVYEGIKTKRKLFIVIGVYQSIFTIIAILGFLFSVVKV